METEAKKSGIICESPVLNWKNEKRFLIPDVNYRGQTGTYRLFEQMTKAMNQEQLAEFYETEKQKGNPHPTSMSLIWNIITRGYELRNENPENAERLRKFLKKGFRDYPNTLTAIIYNPSENDEIMNNYRTSDQYSMYGKVVGLDGPINEVSDANILEQLLGTKDIAKINGVSQWINGTNAHIWRLNSKPSQKVERVAVRFYVDDNRFIFNCWYPHDEYPAFRVLKVD